MKWWHQILVFWMLSFKSICHCPPSPSSRGSLVTFLFLPLDWYHLHIWSCWYFSWQSWFQLVIHPTQHFPWCVMYSTHTVNKQSDSIQPWHTPFPIWNMLFHVRFCWFLTYIQVLQEAGKVVWYSHFFKNFPQFVVIHTFKGFSSQWKRSRHFSGIPLPFLWSSECWQFDFWFLCLF